MEWQVLYDPEFQAWLLEQPRELRRDITTGAGMLGNFGPTLGRPHVDTLKGSRYSNMKELRAFSIKASRGGSFLRLIQNVRQFC